MYITKPCQHWKREIWWLVSGSSNTQFLNLRFKKIIKQHTNPTQMPSGGCCIALWDAVDYRYVSSRLCRDNAATGFWLSVGGIGGLAVYIVVGNGTKQWRPGSVNITR